MFFWHLGNGCGRWGKVYFGVGQGTRFTFDVLGTHFSVGLFGLCVGLLIGGQGRKMGGATGYAVFSDHR